MMTITTTMQQLQQQPQPPRSSSRHLIAQHQQQNHRHPSQARVVRNRQFQERSRVPQGALIVLLHEPHSQQVRRDEERLAGCAAERRLQRRVWGVVAE